MRERQARRVAQASDVAPTRLEQHRQREPPDGFPPDPFAEPQRAGLALPDSGPTPQPTQRIADHDGTDGAWNVEKVMGHRQRGRSEEHTSELQSLMRTSYAVFCLNKKKD